jgi:CHAT domain-containing protein
LEALELHNLQLSRSSTLIHIPLHLHHLPPRTLIITYGVFDNRLVIYANDCRGPTRTAVSVGRSRIESLVSAFEQAIARDDRSAFRQVGRALEKILVEPISEQAAAADTLAFVGDPAFGNLPFGALVGPNKHFLVEGHAVVVTPSISAYLRASHTRTATSRALLSVGNPSTGDRSEPLADLAGAKSEAEEIAAMYPSHALLVEGDASKARVMGALPYCDAAHFAVHANAGIGDAMPPHLILSRTPDSEGILTAPEVAALRLDSLRTVVLAGCSTAISSARSRTDSLVNAFLAAGAGSVIGTLWQVEDDSTRTMSIAIHRELRKGSTPAQALRTTQLEMIRRNTAPSVWASLQLYGSGR